MFTLTDVEEFAVWRFDVKGIAEPGTLIVKADTPEQLLSELQQIPIWANSSTERLLVTAQLFNADIVRIVEEDYLDDQGRVRKDAFLNLDASNKSYLEQNSDIIGEILHEQDFFRSRGYTSYEGFSLLYQGKTFRDWIEEQARKEGIPHDDLFNKIFLTQNILLRIRR